MRVRPTRLRHVRPRDEGAVLILVLVAGMVLGLVVGVLLNYISSAIRLGQVTEARADRLASASAAMQDAIERVRLGRSLCLTDLGTSGGVTYDFPVDLNDSTVEVSCQRIAGDLSEIVGWAMVVTGEGGVPDGEGLLTASGAGTAKLFGGPFFVADLGLLGLAAPVQLRDGDLWYSDTTCPGVTEYTGLTIADMTFLPAGVRGTVCTDRTWDEVFVEPPVPDLSVLPAGDPAGTDIGGCRVFDPGHYTTAPVFGPNNYFMSGDYWFDDVVVTIKQAMVTAGRPGDGGALQELNNQPCDAARDADPATDGLGATFYLSGASSIVSEAQGALEVMPRLQGNSFVSVHALPASTLTYTDDLIGTKPGQGKEMVVHGLLWAPRARLTLDEVTNTTAAQLTGGAVFAVIDLGSSASTQGFVIAVEGSPASGRLRLQALADNKGITLVEVIADTRFTNPENGAGVGTWELAVNSWRVDGTAD